MDENTIKKAMSGDTQSQSEVLESVSDIVFNLSLRMLGNIEDAKDVSQEIFIRILDKLSTFRFESAFSTWVYRLSVNVLLRERKQRSRYQGISFDVYAMDLDKANFDVPYESDLEVKVLAEELKYSCSNVMLQCLDDRSRCIYVLGTMFHIDANQGAQIMGISAVNYRQILSRTRKKVHEFLDSYCMASGHCDCMRRIGHAIRTHRLPSDHCDYMALKPIAKERLCHCTEVMENFETQSDLFATLPYYEGKGVLEDVIQKVKECFQDEQASHV